jgi:hypothetical protein
MRRLMAMGMTIAGLVVALFVGPLGTTAATPFVYGCAPAASNVASPTVSKVTLYNGSAAIANITMKLLASDGTNLSGLMSPAGSTFAIAATNSRWVDWSNPAVDPAFDNTIPSTARVVSDQSIAVGIDIDAGSNETIFPCSYLHP